MGVRIRLLFLGTHQLGHGLANSLRLDGISSDGLGQSFNQWLCILAGRRIVGQSEDGTGTVPVANLDQRGIVNLGIREFLEIGDSFLALSGPDEVVDRAPELEWSFRLLGKQLGPRSLGSSPRARVQTGNH